MTSTTSESTDLLQQMTCPHLPIAAAAALTTTRKRGPPGVQDERDSSGSGTDTEKSRVADTLIGGSLRRQRRRSYVTLIAGNIMCGNECQLILGEVGREVFWGVDPMKAG